MSTHDTTITATDLHNEPARILNRVLNKNKRVVISRNKREIACIVPMRDATLLDELELLSEGMERHAKLVETLKLERFVMQVYNRGRHVPLEKAVAEIKGEHGK